MSPNRTAAAVAAATIAAGAAVAGAQTRVITFNDLEEGFHGYSFTHQGVTYHTINQVSGVFPNGDTFGPQEFDQVIVEDATYAYDDFPGWGTPDKALTFGSMYVPGPNLSVGRVSSVTMDLDQVHEFASFELLYYENGPWGGISFHLDALLNGEVVAGDSFTIAGDGSGDDRDNPAAGMLAVEAGAFDQLHFYAMYGDEFSLPRALIDNFTLRIPAPGAGVAMMLGLGAIARRRRA